MSSTTNGATDRRSDTWREAVLAQMPEDWAHDIDIFEGQIELMQQDKLDERVFAETRLRQGVYGQRYDNGQRHDGIQTKTLDFGNDRVKGPETLWEAPGMQRIKIPFGGMTPDQLDVLAELADEYSDGILHVTTRQDFQLHYVHIEDTPDLMRRLAAVDITTREAGGNAVRNVTACPLAGVCNTESFDVTPYSNALTFFLLGHDDIQDFGRKFKVSFSGCEHEACGLVKMHDLGLIARVKEVDGVHKRGFAIYVGGGLGTVPHQAQVLSEFVPEEEILPISQAVSRVFARLGEKKNRARARIKFLVAELGIEEFRRLVFEERKLLPHDDRWTAYLDDLPDYHETPLKPPSLLNGERAPDGFAAWYATNAYAQRQQGYYVVTVNLPLGDLTTTQAFQLADIARKYVGDNMRTTVEQNIVLRWVAEADLPNVYTDLRDSGLGDADAGAIVDITSCPGTDTCKLGIVSSRGLAAELRTRLTQKNATLPEAVKDLRIKISGCFNSCGQHHVADIGFFGVSRRSGNYKAPHYQIVLGGKWRDNAGSYGLAVGAVPSKSIPDVVDAITDQYVLGRTPDEDFQAWIGRLGKKGARTIIQPYMKIPTYAEQPDFFRDWGDSREFTIGDIGIGECAGEVVSLFSMEMSRAESEVFEAQVALEEQDYARADNLAYNAMLLAARALVRVQFLDVGMDPDQIVSEFRTRFYDTELFFDKYARGKFAQYLLKRYERGSDGTSADGARRLTEEALLFIEATHEAESRLNNISLEVQS